MEAKDVAVVFLALLSALLFGCLTFSAAHNAELQAQFQQTAVGDHHHIMQESKISLSEW